MPWYDSGVRFLTTDGIFLSSDPHSENNYHISPYSYCGGDPVNRVDPEGADDYIFDNKGRYTIIQSDDDFDRLVFADNESMILYDKAIMSNMVEKVFSTRNLEGDIETNYMHYSIVDYSSDLIAAFIALATHTNVEWGLYKDGSGTFLLGTQHYSDHISEGPLFRAATLSHNTFGNVSSKIHSHTPGYESEVKSMEADYHNMESTPNIHSYVFFPESGSFYEVKNMGVKRIKGFPRL